MAHPQGRHSQEPIPQIPVIPLSAAPSACPETAVSQRHPWHIPNQTDLSLCLWEGKDLGRHWAARHSWHDFYCTAKLCHVLLQIIWHFVGYLTGKRAKNLNTHSKSVNPNYLEFLTIFLTQLPSSFLYQADIHWSGLPSR